MEATFLPCYCESGISGSHSSYCPDARNKVHSELSAYRSVVCWGLARSHSLKDTHT